MTVAALTLREHEALHAAGQQADRQPSASPPRASAPGSTRRASQRHRRRQRQQRARHARTTTMPEGTAELAKTAENDLCSLRSSRSPRFLPIVACKIASGISASRRRPGIREQREDRAAEQAIGERARIAPLDLRARRFDERRVLHAGRTRRDARHAAEAGVEMADERRRHLRAAFEARLHQVDAAARRVHLLAPQHIGRTGRQAEAAVHALVDQRRIGRMFASNAAVAPSALWRAGACPPALAASSQSEGGSQRPPSRVEDPVRIERALQRVEQRLTRAVRSPDIDERLELIAIRATMTTLPNSDDARSCSMTAACAGASPSIRIRPAPIAARPLQRRSCTRL